jgi:hypothetical protein
MNEGVSGSSAELEVGKYGGSWREERDHERLRDTWERRPNGFLLNVHHKHGACIHNRQHEWRMIVDVAIVGYLVVCAAAEEASG